ncbi:MmoB/DmpM family protein [Alicyclobacillus shizuokensis]|uniref:MmoB/DmpM family protein n=1 Tax=Alicyclobacillus shizuokensis TaxID=392014 RepID=UPI0009F900F0|nr:MmoB/DmpM family protein [Alicyclobacillus shizuokensis]MCL6625362.1 MmoB/DmpM family protein [Alicyclobacillus shizuokensis]
MATSQQQYVGVDLDKNGGAVTDAVVEAIQQDNPGVELVDFNIYVKVKAPQRMIIRRQLVEDILGRNWDLQELHMVMASYFGFIEEWDEEKLVIRWSADES